MVSCMAPTNCFRHSSIFKTWELDSIWHVCLFQTPPTRKIPLQSKKGFDERTATLQNILLPRISCLILKILQCLDCGEAFNSSWKWLVCTALIIWTSAFFIVSTVMDCEPLKTGKPCCKEFTVLDGILWDILFFKLLYIVKTKGDCSLCSVKSEKYSNRLSTGFLKIGSQTYVLLDFSVVFGQLSCSLTGFQQDSSFHRNTGPVIQFEFNNPFALRLREAWSAGYPHSAIGLENCALCCTRFAI